MSTAVPLTLWVQQNISTSFFSGGNVWPFLVHCIYWYHTIVQYCCLYHTYLGTTLSPNITQICIDYWCTNCHYIPGQNGTQWHLLALEHGKITLDYRTQSSTGITRVGIHSTSQGDERENTGVLEDIRFISDQIMYDTLSEGKRNNNGTSYRVLNGRKK